MFYFQLKCHPLPENSQFGKIVGAYVAAYIDFKELNGAYQLALFYAAQSEWEVLVLVDHAEIDEDQFRKDPDTTEKYHFIKENGLLMEYFSFNEDENG